MGDIRFLNVLDVEKSNFYFKLYFAPCQIYLKLEISLRLV